MHLLQGVTRRQNAFPYLVAVRDTGARPSPAVYCGLRAWMRKLGVLYARIQSPRGDDFAPPDVDAKLVKFGTLGLLFERGTPRITVDRHRRASSARQAHARRRYRSW